MFRSIVTPTRAVKKKPLKSFTHNLCTTLLHHISYHNNARKRKAAHKSRLQCSVRLCARACITHHSFLLTLGTTLCITTMHACYVKYQTEPYANPPNYYQLCSLNKAFHFYLPLLSFLTFAFSQTPKTFFPIKHCTTHSDVTRYPTFTDKSSLSLITPFRLKLLQDFLSAFYSRFGSKVL